jgi:hypothetical protein
LTGFFRARHELPEPRPGFWSMRFMLDRASRSCRLADAGPPGSGHLRGRSAPGLAALESASRS